MKMVAIQMLAKRPFKKYAMHYHLAAKMDLFASSTSKELGTGLATANGGG
jgi:hypothetical protein